LAQGAIACLGNHTSQWRVGCKSRSTDPAWKAFREPVQGGDAGKWEARLSLST